MSVLQCLHDNLQATGALVHFLQSYKFFSSQVLATTGYCMQSDF